MQLARTDLKKATEREKKQEIIKKEKDIKKSKKQRLNMKTIEERWAHASFLGNYGSRRGLLKVLEENQTN